MIHQYEELFNKIDQSGTIKTEEDLREKIRIETLNTYKHEADRQFMNQVQKALLKEANISLPDEFLKRYFLETSKDEKVTAEKVEQDYLQSSDALRWRLIENSLARKYEIKVSEDDVKEYVKDYFRKIRVCMVSCIRNPSACGCRLLYRLQMCKLPDPISEVS